MALRLPASLALLACLPVCLFRACACGVCSGRADRGHTAVQAWKPRLQDDEGGGGGGGGGDDYDEDGRNIDYLGPQRMSAKDKAEVPVYRNMSSSTLRAWSAGHGGAYVPHTQTADTNTRPLLSSGAGPDPAVVFAFFFAEHLDLNPADYVVVPIDVSPRDLLAPADARTRAAAYHTMACLPLHPCRIGGGRRSGTADPYLMFSEVRDTMTRDNTDAPMRSVLETMVTAGPSRKSGASRKKTAGAATRRAQLAARRARAAQEAMRARRARGRGSEEDDLDDQDSLDGGSAGGGAGGAVASGRRSYRANVGGRPVRPRTAAMSGRLLGQPDDEDDEDDEDGDEEDDRVDVDDDGDGGRSSLAFMLRGGRRVHRKRRRGPTMQGRRGPIAQDREGPIAQGREGPIAQGREGPSVQGHAGSIVQGQAGSIVQVHGELTDEDETQGVHRDSHTLLGAASTSAFAQLANAVAHQPLQGASFSPWKRTRHTGLTPVLRPPADDAQLLVAPNLLHHFASDEE